MAQSPAARQAALRQALARHKRSVEDYNRQVRKYNDAVRRLNRGR